MIASSFHGFSRGFLCFNAFRAVTTSNVGASGPPGKPVRLVEGVVDRIVDRLSRGDFARDSNLLARNAGSAGGAGEAGGGDLPPPLPRTGGGGIVTYDYEAVPRSIDVDAFRKALTSALTEHVGAAGGGAPLAHSGQAARKLMEASPTERQALAESLANGMADKDLHQMLAEEPIPVVRSRLAGMLERGGFF